MAPGTVTLEAQGSTWEVFRGHVPFAIRCQLSLAGKATVMPLPTHRIEIRKSYNNRSWSNDYLVVAANMDAAAAQAARLLTMERTFHLARVQFLFYMVSTIQKADRVFRHVAVNAPGQAGGVGLQVLPLFNTARVDLTTVDSDPARKYYRIPLPEDAVADGIISDVWRGTIGDAVFAALTGTAPAITLVTTKGNVVTGMAVLQEVQERQLRRRRKKKASTP